MVRSQRYVCAFLVLLVGTLAAGAVARAAVVRPNGLDRRVDAIPNVVLMTRPATELVDPPRQQAADRLVNWTIPGEIASFLAAGAALFFFWQSGWAAVWRDRLRRAVSSEMAVRFLFGASLALIAKLASFVPDFYLYRVNRILGIFTELTPGWANEWLLTTALAALGAGVVAAAVLWLVDRTPLWYAYTACAIVVVAVGAAFVAPWIPSLGHYEPLRGTQQSALHDLLRRADDAGVPVLVENRSRRTGVEVAQALGVGPTRQVVISDTLIAADTPGEVQFVVAHQLAHFAHGDILRVVLLRGFMLMVGVALAVSIADRVRFRRDDDALSRLSLVGAVLACVYMIAVPIDAAISRHTEPSADAYALHLTGDRASAVRALVRSADQQLTEVCPDVLARAVFDVEPPLGQRVAGINGITNGCP